MLPIHFAPLQGYTDAPYRNAHAEIFGGVDAYYTPFWRIEHGEVRRKDIADLNNDSTGKIVAQIIVRDSAEFRLLVNRLRESGSRRIDINMGCPFPLQANKGRGAGLLQHPSNVREILTEVSAATDIDFSLKMRLGNLNSQESFALLPMLNDTPLTHITLHPRIGRQQYKGTVDLESFAKFLALSKHPVIYNGDITSPADIKRIERDFPAVKGIMIGRGLLARPSLAAEYQRETELPRHELLQNIIELHGKLLARYSATLQGEAQLLMKMKTFWDYLEPTIGHRPHKLIRKASSLPKYLAALPSLPAL